MNDTESEGLDAAMFLAELLRDVLYNHERYKLYGAVYRDILLRYQQHSFGLEQAANGATRAVNSMDSHFEPMNDAPTEINS